MLILTFFHYIYVAKSKTFTMKKIQQFIAQYIDAVSEGGQWEQQGLPKNASIIQYWENLLDTRLAQFGFQVNVQIASLLQTMADGQGSSTPPECDAKYFSDKGQSVTISINKNQITDNIHEGQLPKSFDEVSQFVAKIIHQQVLNAKYRALSGDYIERLKEMESVRQASVLLGHNSYDLMSAIHHICDSISSAMQFPKYAMACIKYGKKTFKTKDFEQCGHGMVKSFEAANEIHGTIEVYYRNGAPISEDADPFLPEEHHLIDYLTVMITSASYVEAMKTLKKFNDKRMRELMTINRTTAIIKEGRDIERTLGDICNILPEAMQYPRHACARIRYDGKEYISKNFIFTHRSIREQFVCIDSNKGTIEAFYTKELPTEDNGPFLKEECDLLTNIGRLTAGFINDTIGRDMLFRSAAMANLEKKEDLLRRKLTENHQPLQNYFNQQMLDKYIYLDMMKFKVKHVLFVATLYDAFCLENEDSFFGRFMGDVMQFSLYVMPRITGVSCAEDAITTMENSNIDLVIIMPTDPSKAVSLSEKLREISPSVPVYLLVNKKNEILKYEEIVTTSTSISKLYTWNGDSNIFFTIVKALEDSINVENDTQVGLVKVILLIEDSPVYYSRYLEILYTTVFGQVAQLIPEVEKNEIDKIVKMRSRPKILHAKNYEEAITIFNKYRDNLMCVISDIEFEWGGEIDHQAGFKFLRHMRSLQYTVPVIFQSTEQPMNLAPDLYKDPKLYFVNKNSPRLLNEIRHYLKRYMGYGEFIFKTADDKIIGRAHSLREFENLLKEVPTDSLYRHGRKNQFSIWLMGRGEIQLAQEFKNLHMEDEQEAEDLRQVMLDLMVKYRKVKKRGKILSFDETSSIDERNIVTLAPGSLGGKGRGIAFTDTVIYNLADSPLTDRINIWAPVTMVVGTEEFSRFISTNGLFDKIIDNVTPYDELKLLFWDGHLSGQLRERISIILSQTDNPLAIRSSSTSEDSVSQPFAGVFSTFIIPNEKDNKAATLELVCHAIKLIYASMYSDTARRYYDTVHHNIAEEKMAIVIQEVVGSRFGNYFYPHISGVAQSYNFYPVANMKPEEGYAVAGLGLGCYVVNGWPSYRFSPMYPEISMYTKDDLLNSTQTKFYALDLSLKDIDLLQHGELAALKLLNIYDAEKHGSLKHLASVYNPDNDTFSPGLDDYGPRIVNFADVLQYNYFPLAEAISKILAEVKDAFGSPVEIEYAVNLNKAKNGKPTFYLLQIKPMVGSFNTTDIDLTHTSASPDTLLYTDQSLGNGVIDSITDVIYIDEQKFDKLETVEMKREISYLNSVLGSENRKYILIGPGRWGTSDRFLGVPVQWSEINNAAVIIETSLDGYPLDFSNGSHFFHNITSMNVGYFAVKKENRNSYLRREILEAQTLVQSTKYFRHVRFTNPLKVTMNGSKNEAAIELMHNSL